MPNEKKSTPTNVFSNSFLDRFRRRDEPSAVSEAEHAGPWTVRDVSGGFGVFRDSDAEDATPQAVFEHREHALLLAAVLPGVGREPFFHLDPDGGPEGHGIQTVWGDSGTCVVGQLHEYEPEVMPALHLAEVLVRNPASLALLLEAAGPTALRLTGEILAQRMELEGR